MFRSVDPQGFRLATDFIEIPTMSVTLVMVIKMHATAERPIRQLRYSLTGRVPNLNLHVPEVSKICGIQSMCYETFLRNTSLTVTCKEFMP